MALRCVVLSGPHHSHGRDARDRASFPRILEDPPVRVKVKVSVRVSARVRVSVRVSARVRVSVMVMVMVKAMASGR